jgi:HlyD family secretion protein/GAF domain
MSPASQTLGAPTRGLRRPLDWAIGELLSQAQGSASVTAFLQSALTTIASAIRSPFAELEARIDTNVVSAEYTPAGTPGEFWRKTVDSLLADTLGQPRLRALTHRDGESGLALIAAPIGEGGDACDGAIAMVTQAGSAEDLRDALTSLHALTALTSLLAESLAPSQSSHAQAAPDSPKALQRVGQYESAKALAYALTNNLRSRDGCDQAALGVVRGRRVQILSISGLDEVSANSPGVRHILGSMEECLDLGRTVVHQGDDENGGRIHRQWHAAAGAAPVASIPLRSGDEIVAVLSVRRQQGEPFSPADPGEFQALVEPYAGALDLIDRAHRSIAVHAAASLATTTRDFLSRRGLRKKLMLAGAALFTIWTLFGSLDYEVTVPVTLRPAHVRQVAAPFDGVLSQAGVWPGMNFAAGDVLCAFDTGEVELEVERLASELAIFELDESRAMGGDDPVATELARANQRRVRAQLALQRARLERSVLRADRDGLLLAGDLRARLGDSFRKGDPIFELAYGDEWKLELAVPEGDVGQVAPAMVGRFASLARPEEEYPFAIERVAPSAEQRAGSNVFVAEAKADVDVPWMRAGMEGVARISVGARRPWWVALHRATDFLRLRFWL